MSARRPLWTALVLAAGLALPACSAGAAGDGGVRVVASTEILADLLRAVGGDRVTVETVVPPGGDPHSYEPTPADAAKVARADAAFTNHLLLEEHALIKLFDNNVPDGAPNVSLAEAAERYGATLIPLVEDLGLDVLWLGLAVRGTGGEQRSADVRLTATAFTGPGNFHLYVTDALGNPEVYYDSTDGMSAADVVVLPPGAHTHLNWAFDRPGVHRLTLAAAVDTGGGASRPLGQATFTFAVGVPPTGVPVDGERVVVGDGHADLSVRMEHGDVLVCTASLSCASQQGDVPAARAVIDVPDRAVVEVPADPRFAFLGPPGTRIWELPQAVLGKHVHGEVDPHLWENVLNAKAYAQVMTDTLARVDPAGADGYRARAAAYLARLDELHAYVGERIGAIPRERRKLITTHDAFGYLAKAYDLDIAGFVVPNPAQEPSAAQVTRLTETIRDLRVPAVFVEPHLAARASVLRRVAEDQGVRVCKLYGDAFDEHARSYVDMMRHNADELVRCLA